MNKILLALCLAFFFQIAQAQTDSTKDFLKIENDELDDIEKLLEDEENEKPKKEFARYAFKSTRVVMGQSMEMVGKGVLDFRILHRFGMLKGGVYELFGLDQASMRMSFDYGIAKNLSIGIGRSTFGKEFDGHFKWRIAHQHTNVNPIPFSLIWVSGITINTIKADPQLHYFFSNRVAYFNQLIIGRKFSDGFTLQLSPTLVHRNLVELRSDNNDMYALGVGSRIRITKRTSFILDAYPLLYGYRQNYHVFPMSIGFDIETGGHVFQLHVSNARGMNEKAFITETTQKWDKGEINFGFNLSRVFTIKKNTQANF
ncbi:MAG: DUF5777 family beta-barrel protein [Chitinophagaceae bacterium]